jgi:hypothetical protein
MSTTRLGGSGAWRADVGPLYKLTSRRAYPGRPLASPKCIFHTLRKCVLDASTEDVPRNPPNYYVVTFNEKIMSLPPIPFSRFCLPLKYFSFFGFIFHPLFFNLNKSMTYQMIRDGLRHGYDSMP